jgi:GntR family transcriptional regulator
MGRIQGDHPPLPNPTAVNAPLPLPKYHQVYLVLREQLDEGRFAKGLPAEMQLVKEFGVARVTVRKALERLVSEGRIERVPGRGTVPVGRSRPRRGAAEQAPVPEPLARARLTGLLENIVSMGLRTKVRVVECEVLPAPEAVAPLLQLGPGALVQKAVRVRTTPQGPLSHITTFVPAELARGFGRRELQAKPILVLLEESGVRIGHATQTISARLADVPVARELEVEVGSALLAVTRLIHDEAGRPVQWLSGLYRPDRYHYEMQLSRVGSIDARVWVNRELAAPFH